MLIVISNGVIETVKLRKSGFSQRLTFEMFSRRYAILAGGQHLAGNPSRNILQQFLTYHVPEQKDAFVGHTKIFMHDRAAEVLTKKVRLAYKASATTLQARVRTMWACVHAKKLREQQQATLAIQRYVRRLLAARVLFKNWQLAQVNRIKVYFNPMIS